MSVGLPPGAFAFDKSGMRPLPFVGTNVTGLAAWPGQTAQNALLAWGTFTGTGSTTYANLMVSTPDGSNTRVMVTETNSMMLPILLPLRWSQDGRRLFYSSEPSGLGGYILFDGFSSLYGLDVATGVTTTLIPKFKLGMICMDYLANDASMVVHHCGNKAITVLNLTNNQSSTIKPPAVITDAAALGSARFSPDHSRVAYALARHNPNDEKGWIAVSDGLGGESKLVFTGAPGEYLSVASWLDENTIIFQRPPVGSRVNTPGSIWSIRADGSDAHQLAEGHFLTLVESATGGQNDTGSTLPIAAPGADVQGVSIEWRQANGACQIARVGPDAVAVGPCGGPLAVSKYPDAQCAAAFTHYKQMYATFRTQTVAGSVVFTGTGATVATPSEQRMIAEFAQLVASEATAGRAGAADGMAIACHREGGIAGFCDDVIVRITGEVNATSCRGGKAQDLGMKWLNAAQLEQLFSWIDHLKGFSITHEGPVAPDELVIGMIFSGRGTTEPNDTDKQGIQSFAQQLRNEFTQP
jgi:hypothetical protein